MEIKSTALHTDSGLNPDSGHLGKEFNLPEPVSSSAKQG